MPTAAPCPPSQSISSPPRAKAQLQTRLQHCLELRNQLHQGGDDLSDGDVRVSVIRLGNDPQESNKPSGMGVGQIDPRDGRDPGRCIHSSERPQDPQVPLGADCQVADSTIDVSFMVLYPGTFDSLHRENDMTSSPAVN
jgi:hypothetical protein